jgi:hypothetical protein
MRRRIMSRRMIEELYQLPREGIEYQVKQEKPIGVSETKTEILKEILGLLRNLVK